MFPCLGRTRVLASGAKNDEEEDEVVPADAAACLLAVQRAAEGRPRKLVTFEDVNRAVATELHEVCMRALEVPCLRVSVGMCWRGEWLP